jgi:hypothetical protein
MKVSSGHNISPTRRPVFLRDFLVGVKYHHKGLSSTGVILPGSSHINGTGSHPVAFRRFLLLSHIFYMYYTVQYFTVNILLYVCLEKESKRRLTWPGLAHHPFIQVSPPTPGWLLAHSFRQFCWLLG